METRSVPIEGQLDLRNTLRPAHGHFTDDGWWLPARTPHGPGSMKIHRTRENLIGEAWGPGASWLLDRLEAIGGLEDDPSQFETDDPVVSELHERYLGRRFSRTGLVFDSLLVAICGQKVTGQEAHLALTGLNRRFSDAAPGPHSWLRLPADPERMAEAPYYEFHELHLEKRRADVIRAASRAAQRLNDLRGSDVETATGILESIPGVSLWTRAKTLEVSHGDPDQVPVGDFHIKHIVVHHLTGRDRGTDEEMLDLLEPFRPQRGRVIRLLHTLGHEPKFGPRSTPRDITRM